MTCAKRIVSCTIVSLDGRGVTATNHCNNPQTVCPRAPGEGYGKCIAICEQHGHAEIQALHAAQRLGLSVEGASAYVLGHHHACEECCLALKRHGVRTVTIVF